MHAFKRGVCFNMCIIVLKKRRRYFLSIELYFNGKMIYKQNKLDYKRVPLYLRFAPDVETNMMDLLTFDMKKGKRISKMFWHIKYITVYIFNKPNQSVGGGGAKPTCSLSLTHPWCICFCFGFFCDPILK